jgi:asparagine synthase (glutamine-hydrolysing)
MCGISGIVQFNGQPVQKNQIQVLMDQMRHRGPDDEGLFLHGVTGLGHVRLSILDLSDAGHQPMLSNDSRYVLVFNGEIYNYRELKKELQGSYEFRSRTDTEVLLAAWQRWGRGCLNKLNGDFAFAIYDTLKQTLFGARDRFGVKPFYYVYEKDRFIFASEIKSMLPLLGQRSVNPKMVFEYLAYNRTDQSEETFFKSILKLKHGHCFTLHKGELLIKRWYNLEEQLEGPNPISPLAYREELRSAIGLRLRSDVPVGVCLSGGIDSSTITSVVYQDHGVKDLHTFSAVFGQGEKMDESRFIRAYAPLLRNMHYAYPTAETFFRDYTQYIETQSEPSPGISPYAQFKVMQAAQHHVSVTLDGQGADEMLGGYTYFYGSYLKELLTWGKGLSFIREALAYYQQHNSLRALKYTGYYLLPSFLKLFLRSRNTAMTESFFHTYQQESDLEMHLFSPRSLHSFFLQHFEYKLEHLLKYDDLNSMHFSIESRVPFLDHHLVEKTLSLPSNQVMKSGVSKHILRESVKDILPPEIYQRRDKIGFDTPADQWLRTPPFEKLIRELLHDPRFANRGILDPRICLKSYELHLKKKVNLGREIWKWMHLELWMRRFIDQGVSLHPVKDNRVNISH